MSNGYIFFTALKRLVVTDGWKAEYHNHGSVRLYCPDGQKYTPIEAIRLLGENGGCCATVVSDLNQRASDLIWQASCNICNKHANPEDKKAFRATRIRLLESCRLVDMYPTPRPDS